MKTAIIELQTRGAHVRPSVVLKRYGVTLDYRLVGTEGEQVKAFWELRRLAESAHGCTHVNILGKREKI